MLKSADSLRGLRRCKPPHVLMFMRIHTLELAFIESKQPSTLRNNFLLKQSQNVQTHTLECIHTYIHTWAHMYVHTDHTYIHTTHAYHKRHSYTYTDAYIHITHTHIIHTYRSCRSHIFIHTYIHTYSYQQKIT